MSSSPRPSLSLAPLLAFLLAAIVMTACSGSADPVPEALAGGDSTASTRDASPSASPAPSAAVSTQETVTIVEPDQGVLPRVVSYGILVWTLDNAVITNQDPGPYVAGEVGRMAPKTYAILDFELANDNVAVHIAATDARLELTLPDGTVVRGTNEMRGSVPPSSTSRGRYAFEVPADTTFDGLVLTIADPGREPSVALPLSGTAPEVEENTVTEVGLEAQVPLTGIEMTWTLDRLLAGSDWPLPVGHRGGTLLAGARAEAGHRWLGINATVAVDACACRGGVLDQAGSVRLLVDGQPFVPEARESSREIMNAQTVSEVMLVFSIPEGTETANLQIGPLDEPDQQTEVELDLG